MPRYSVLVEQGQQDYPLRLVQGVTHFFTVAWVDSENTPFNITDYVAELQIRRTDNADDPALVALTSVGDAGISLDLLNGLVIVTISADATDALPEMGEGDPGRYDLLMTAPGAGGHVDRLLAGPVTVQARVTR